MNTKVYFKNSTKAIAAFMFATMLVTGFTACSEDYSETLTEDAIDEHAAKTRSIDDGFLNVALTGSQRLKFERKEYLSQATTYSFEYPTKSYTGEDILLSATLTAWTPATPTEND